MDSHRVAGENDEEVVAHSGPVTHPAPWIFLMNHSPPTALTSSPTQIIPCLSFCSFFFLFFFLIFRDSMLIFSVL